MDRTDLALDGRSLQARPRQAAGRHRPQSSTASARTKPRCRASPTRSSDLLDRGWHYATLYFGETQIRTGHMLVGGLQVAGTAARLRQSVAGVRQDQRRRARRRASRKIWAGSEEENLRPMDGSGLRAAGTPGAEAAAGREGHDRARPLLAGPHRQGRGRRHGPGARPRRGNPPDHRRADAPAAEQSDPHRRGRRRQDRGGRRLRPARCRRRRAAAAAGRASCACSTSA